MANWFYYDDNGRRLGPVNDAQLKMLVGSGVIDRGTQIETATGNLVFAGNIRGLFPESPPPGQPQAARFCSACGNQVVPTAVICPKCGSPIQGAKPIGNNGNYFDANALGIGFFDILKTKYSMLNGRARRREYWMFQLIALLISLIPMGICTAGELNENGTAIVMIMLIVIGIIFAVPTVCLQVRRLHDIGLSGWTWFINLIPYIGGVIVLILMCRDSQRGDNQYGPNPKGEY